MTPQTVMYMSRLSTFTYTLFEHAFCQTEIANFFLML